MIERVAVDVVELERERLSVPNGALLALATSVFHQPRGDESFLEACLVDSDASAQKIFQAAARPNPIGRWRVEPNSRLLGDPAEAVKVVPRVWKPKHFAHLRTRPPLPGKLGDGGGFDACQAPLRDTPTSDGRLLLPTGRRFQAETVTGHDKPLIVGLSGRSPEVPQGGGERFGLDSLAKDTSVGKLTSRLAVTVGPCLVWDRNAVVLASRTKPLIVVRAWP
ncbi:hypothetical protein ACFY4C_39470 [Actinomadura viridis]|uniref:hypothetical protein n=1 Tax=Actinomadura viridis TaxID=58110 RepID=UPI00369C0E75